MLAAVPGMQVMADELIEDALSVATLSDEVTDIAEIQSGELLSDEDRAQDVSAEVYDEEIVGVTRKSSEPEELRSAIELARHLMKQRELLHSTPITVRCMVTGSMNLK